MLQTKLFLSYCTGLHDLMYDNKTESMRTINILERMNVYQEVFLSILYRIFHIKVSVNYKLAIKLRESQLQLDPCSQVQYGNLLHRICWSLCFHAETLKQ